jgi:hypothetical protein
VLLGKRLVLDSEEYEALDEIIARFISPMNDLVRDMTAYRKFNKVR